MMAPTRAGFKMNRATLSAIQPYGQAARQTTDLNIEPWDWLSNLYLDLLTQIEADWQY